MSFDQTFCASPWLHMRINNSGSYEPCRWMAQDGSTRVQHDFNIKNMMPGEYFQSHMAELRTDLLQGRAPAMCQNCHVMEQHGKVSGRQKQLLKAGVLPTHFEKSLAGSPLRSAFDYSHDHQGRTTRQVIDWQIDLGNYCNSACVFCHPESSSTLATEFKRIGLINQTPPAAWCDNPQLLSRFIKDLLKSPHLQYLHFIGGETVITPGFKKILSALVDADLAKDITVGFTTNLTVWSDSVVNLLKQFRMINLGMSVETLSPVNDYVRYPSEIDKVKETLNQWVELGKQQQWLMQIRTTPTCLTVHDLITVYDYAWKNHLAVESCNFLSRPEFLRISVLPQQQRQLAKNNLAQWIESHWIDQKDQIINTRDPNLARQQLLQDATSYVNYLENSKDESHLLPELVSYLKRLELNRGNSIIDYLPQYEDLFRSAGY